MKPTSAEIAGLIVVANAQGGVTVLNPNGYAFRVERENQGQQIRLIPTKRRVFTWITGVSDPKEARK